MCPLCTKYAAVARSPLQKSTSSCATTVFASAFMDSLCKTCTVCPDDCRVAEMGMSFLQDMQKRETQVVRGFLYSETNPSAQDRQLPFAQDLRRLSWHSLSHDREEGNTRRTPSATSPHGSYVLSSQSLRYSNCSWRGLNCSWSRRHTPTAVKEHKTTQSKQASKQHVLVQSSNLSRCIIDIYHP